MFTTQLLDVVTTAGVLYIVALGLLIVYGVLKIINLADGAFLVQAGEDDGDLGVRADVEGHARICSNSLFGPL